MRSKGDDGLVSGLPLPTRRKRNLTFVDSGLGTTGIPDLTDDESSPDERDETQLPTTNNNKNQDNSNQINNNRDNNNQINNNQDDGNNPENVETMALPANQSISLNDALVCVPRFDGVPSDLIDFATCCREAKGMLPDAAEANLVKLVYSSKLSPNVKDSLNNIIPATIAELVKNLKKNFIPTKSLFQLQGELGRIFRRGNESVINYVNRLRKKAREIVDCYQSQNAEATPEQLQEFKDGVDKNIADCFTNNLINEIDQRMPPSATVEEALQNAI